MKKFALLIASVVAVSVFAAEPVKKEKVEAKPAVATPAVTAKTDIKSEPAKDKKTEAVKK